MPSSPLLPGPATRRTSHAYPSSFKHHSPRTHTLLYLRQLLRNRLILLSLLVACILLVVIRPYGVPPLTYGSKMNSLENLKWDGVAGGVKVDKGDSMDLGGV
ncbi:hypothetical protein HK097_002738, partial [Rhizophlyctis rosea]